VSRRKKSPLSEPISPSIPTALAKVLPTVETAQVEEMGKFNKLLLLSLFSALRIDCDCDTCKRLRKASEIYEKLVEGL